MLAPTGIVHAAMPTLTANARQQATWLWESMQNHQMCLWYDNWVKKNFGVDPLHPDRSINCTVVAVPHLPTLPLFPGHVSLLDVVQTIGATVEALQARHADLFRLVYALPDIMGTFVRVPLDIVTQKLGQDGIGINLGLTQKVGQNGIGIDLGLSPKVGQDGIGINLGITQKVGQNGIGIKLGLAQKVGQNGIGIKLGLTQKHGQNGIWINLGLTDDTLSIWLGAVRESGYLGRIPNCSEVPVPPARHPFVPLGHPAPTNNNTLPPPDL